RADAAPSSSKTTRASTSVSVKQLRQRQHPLVEKRCFDALGTSQCPDREEDCLSRAAVSPSTRTALSSSADGASQRGRAGGTDRGRACCRAGGLESLRRVHCERGHDTTAA